MVFTINPCYSFQNYTPTTKSIIPSQLIGNSFICNFTICSTSALPVKFFSARKYSGFALRILKKMYPTTVLLLRVEYRLTLLWQPPPFPFLLKKYGSHSSLQLLWPGSAKMWSSLIVYYFPLFYHVTSSLIA